MTIFFRARWDVMKAGREEPRADTDPLQKFTEEEAGHLEKGTTSIVERKEEEEEEEERTRGQGFWAEGKATV